MEQNKIILNGHYLNQSFRACVLFCELANIPYEVVSVDIFTEEFKQEIHKEINPYLNTPIAKDADKILTESHAILRYLADTRKTEDNWYPKDPFKRAQIDMYLDWHHSNIRLGAGGYLFKKIFLERKGIIIHESVYKIHDSIMRRSLNLMNFWLGQHKYIANNDISIADISAFCEIMQLYIINFDFSKFPKIKAWINNMLELKQVKRVHECFLDAIKPINKDQKLLAKL